MPKTRPAADRISATPSPDEADVAYAVLKEAAQQLATANTTFSTASAAAEAAAEAKDDARQAMYTADDKYQGALTTLTSLLLRHPDGCHANPARPNTLAIR